MSSFLSENQLSWFQQIFFERFGINFSFESMDGTIIIKKDKSEKEVIFSTIDIEFYQFGETKLKCYDWDAGKDGFNGVLDSVLKAPNSKELVEPIITFNSNGAMINYDVLGLIYWMLNRLEEIGRIDLDNHQRFSAISSHAYQYDYLERPIIDEWLDIIKQVIQRVWPNIKLKEHNFELKISHDVDRPSRYGFASFSSLIRSICGDIIKYRNISTIIQAPIIRLNTKRKLHEADIYNTFDWLMDVSEINNIKSAFYFLCGRTDNDRDADYEAEHAVIRELMNRIHTRGHEIGLHPSYNTYQNKDLLINEFLRLKKVCNKENIIQSEWGGRMHYLRWEHPNTMQAWSDAGLMYDSTLGYADHPGFRCGTCFEYPAFNPITKQQLNLRLRPLIVMEVSIMSPVYLGLGQGDKALKCFLDFKNKCKKVNGYFTLLWHNSELDTNLKKQIYKKVIEQ